MKFIKLDSPKLGEVLLNVNCIFYLKRTDVGDTKTFIHTTNGTIGVKQTIEEIGVAILNV